MTRHRLLQYLFLLLSLLAAGGCNSRETVDELAGAAPADPVQQIEDPLLYLYQQQALEYAARNLHPAAREAFLRAAHRCWELDGRPERGER